MFGAKRNFLGAGAAHRNASLIALADSSGLSAQPLTRSTISSSRGRKTTQ